MDSRALHEFLGKPSAIQVEAKIQYAQELRDKAKDPLERDRAIELAKSYIQVWQYLDELSKLAEAKTALARVSGDSVKSLKNALKDKERVVITRGQTEYQIVGQNGEALDARSLSSLHGPKYDAVALASMDKAAWKNFRAELREIKKRDKRWKAVCAFAIEVSRVILEGTALVVEPKHAELQVNLKGREKDYRARVELIRKGHNTAIDDKAMCYIDGKEVPTFWGAKA
jgi:hypothetical protein